MSFRSQVDLGVWLDRFVQETCFVLSHRQYWIEVNCILGNSSMLKLEESTALHTHTQIWHRKTCGMDLLKLFKSPGKEGRRRRRRRCRFGGVGRRCRPWRSARGGRRRSAPKSARRRGARGRSAMQKLDYQQLFFAVSIICNVQYIIVVGSTGQWQNMYRLKMVVVKKLLLRSMYKPPAINLLINWAAGQLSINDQAADRTFW